MKECALALAKSRAENIENTADLSEDEIAQMKSDIAFGELRSLLDVNVRQAINDELTERQEKRHFGDKLKRHQDDEGKAKAQFDAAEVAKMREEAEKMTASRPDDGKEAIGHFADWMMHSSRQKSYEDADRAAKEAETNAGLFALGAGLGKLANFGAHTALEKWSTDASAASAPETEAPSSGNETAPPNNDADLDPSDMAAQNGYDVEWHGSGADEWVSINGDSNTTSVLKVLSQYAKK